MIKVEYVLNTLMRLNLADPDTSEEDLQYKEGIDLWSALERYNKKYRYNIDRFSEREPNNKNNKEL